jgi:hypothetical protein
MLFSAARLKLQAATPNHYMLCSDWVFRLILVGEFAECNSFIELFLAFRNYLRKSVDLLAATGKHLPKKCTAKNQKMASNPALAHVVLRCNKTAPEEES